jgi:predicted acyltransferase (DUF342 family)
MYASGSAKPLILLAALAAALAARGAEAREHETVARKLGEDLFMAGGDLRVTEGIAGDAILAGGRIATSGAVHGDEVAAGGEVNLGANVEGGLYAAGGRVRLDGKVARNARIAGGKVEVGPEADVQGGLTAGGGQVEVDGRVGKYLQIGAGSTRIDGHIGGDVEVASGELQVGPAAVIDGVLTYYGPQPATVATGAQIKGGMHYVERKHWAPHAHRGMLRGFGPAAWLWLIGWTVVGSVLLALWPGFSRMVAEVALRRPGMALLVGFVVLVCVPVAIVLAIITIIGIPLALLGIGLYVLLLALGYLASAAALGEWLLPRIQHGSEIFTRQRILMFLAVMVALFVLTRIPVLGGIVRFLVILVGVGSLVMAGAARQRAA